MRRSFKEKGKKFLHKISGDTSSSTANTAGESSSSTLNSTECNFENQSFLNEKFSWNIQNSNHLLDFEPFETFMLK